jgi:hypothetical protein
MEDWFNKITYGNISQTSLELLTKKCLSDAVIPILDKKYGSELDFPKNNSETTKGELNQMVKYITSMRNASNSEYLARYLKYDKALLQSIISIFQSKGIDVADIVKSVNEDVAPTIHKLKQKYQRPRPNQLAQYFKLKLFPFDTKTGHSPSYPSGHTIQAYTILNIIGNKHPESYDFCKQLIEDVANSRVYLGLHYESDNDASYLIGQEILKLKSITEKYKI